MLFFLTLILACQLAGEVLVVATGLPVPGPVVGMVLLFIGLLFHGRLPDGLGGVADAFLNNLSLLFVPAGVSGRQQLLSLFIVVPAGVGVMLHVGLIGRDIVAISAALVVSTLITVAVTAAMMTWLGRTDGGGGPDA